MNKTILLGLVIGALVISLIVSAVLANEVNASKIVRERANKVLDKHIAAGGAHGEAAKRIKDRLNACCPLCGC